MINLTSNLLGYLHLLCASFAYVFQTNRQIVMNSCILLLSSSTTIHVYASHWKTKHVLSSENNLARSYLSVCTFESYIWTSCTHSSKIREHVATSESLGKHPQRISLKQRRISTSQHIILCCLMRLTDDIY